MINHITQVKSLNYELLFKTRNAHIIQRKYHTFLTLFFTPECWFEFCYFMADYQFLWIELNYIILCKLLFINEINFISLKKLVAEISPNTKN